MATTWRPVPGHEGYYEVSNDGRVRCLRRRMHKANGMPYMRTARELSITPNAAGYRVVNLATPDREKRLHYVHRLVLMAFVGLPDSGQSGLHANDDPGDNRLANLRWGSQSENLHDAISNGLTPHLFKSHCKHGHEWTEANTYCQKKTRHCRECARIRAAHIRESKREKATK